MKCSTCKQKLTQATATIKHDMQPKRGSFYYVADCDLCTGTTFITQEEYEEFLTSDIKQGLEEIRRVA